MRHFVIAGILLAVAAPAYVWGDESWVLFLTLLILIIG